MFSAQSRNPKLGHVSELKACYPTLYILSRMRGTHAMKVGCRVEASPFSPFLIIVDLSVKVLGLLYPMATPNTHIMFSAIISRMWARGR